jgi:hypothetical protein
MYKVIFYTLPNNRSPIHDFLDKCSTSLRNKIVRQLTYVSEFGLTKVIPYLRKVSGTKLWELRILGKAHKGAKSSHETGTGEA